MKQYKLTDADFLECYNPARNQDKVYFVAVMARTDGLHDVVCRYGRRGVSMTKVLKKDGVSYSEAISTLNKIVREKLDKGYSLVNERYNRSAVWSDIADTTMPADPPPLTDPEPQEEAEEKPAMRIVKEGDNTAPTTWFW